ncbi:DUF7560 family zinc ribbon protein [Natronomonas marina]|jgi:hypothetical protein|uniref:DUF7560 family zinc ribbon protein n=1 Tax=Natronomonas marina TaxID=2961939 RepID=UPI0020C9ED9B|nr:hypothetical protein [Natronomonas marina]
MGVEPSEEYTFVCPACDESLAVDTGMKDALIENGCVICRATVTADAFTRMPSAGSH